ncbi:cupin domain-containing protein [Lewinella sp. 4G2]|uniref:cupin domain-containing protein n=1 Tax=Lewinella sp. 4G2 TaxID=1803372 RepID=UPI0007B4D6A8|nr:cupin domain-containing protein [Lewinella sp. 4G2]OAV45437.1 mannose-6-phosphate isomerase [Lewinella sp. 4G2]
MRPKVNLNDKYDSFTELWTPKIVGELNGQLVKLAKVSGEFVWHDHANEDELFLVQRGILHLEFRSGEIITLKEGEFHIVPRGVEHRPFTDEGKEAWIMLIEPATTKHTGDVIDEKTQHQLDWI